MPTIPGTYIEMAATGNEKVDTLINVMIHPTIEEFQQIIINYETATLTGPSSCRFTYQHWNPAFPVEVFLNGGAHALSQDLFAPNYEMGTLGLNFELSPGDSVMATYCFNYFPVHVLEGFVQRAVITANTAGESEATNYTIKNVPDAWLGVLADLVVAMCMEKLLVEYDLWKGRLIFAISNNGIYEGGGDIVGQLETVKRNAEERAYKTLDNRKFRSPSRLAKPTPYYYEALLVGSSSRYKNGTYSYGPLRGASFNKLGGMLPRQ